MTPRHVRPGVHENDLVGQIERRHPESGGRTHRAAAPYDADS